MNFWDRIRFAALRAVAGGTFHVSQTPPGWIDTLAGATSSSGMVVTESTSLTCSAVYACVRVLAETIASLPLVVYRRLPNGGRERATGHYLYSLLHDQPNEEMTSFQWRETAMGHVTLWGNSFSQIEMDGAGRVIGLWPWRPDWVKVRRVNGRLQYAYRLAQPDARGRSEIVLGKDSVLHVPGLGFDGIVGYSVIAMARQSIGMALAAEEFGARFFGNGARPGVVLEHPGKLSEIAEKRLRESWEARHQGPDKANKVAVLEEGLKIHELGIPPDDAQFIETRKFQTVDIARWFRVPPHLIGDLERATFSNIEHQSIDFVVHTIRPWLVRWEQALNLALLTPAERKVYFIELLVDGLLRGDVQSRYQAYAVGRQNGWLSANDIRALENMNPIAGGDVYLIPLNMIPAGQAGQEPPAEGSPVDQREAATVGDDVEERGRRSARARRRLMNAYKRVYKDASARILRREANDIKNAAAKFLGRRDAGSFLLWLDEFYREHQDFIARHIMPVAMAYGELVATEAQAEVGQGRDGAMTPELEDFTRTYVATFAARHSNISKAKIRKIVTEDPTLEALDEELDTWPDKRAETEAQWESSRFNNAMAKAVYIFAGVMKIRWVSFGDSCPYCSDLNGRVVGIQDIFLAPGDFKPDKADKPLTIDSDVGHAPAHNGCDCMTVAG